MSAAGLRGILVESAPEKTTSAAFSSDFSNFSIHCLLKTFEKYTNAYSNVTSIQHRNNVQLFFHLSKRDHPGNT